jgi:hypothetical protein
MNGIKYSSAILDAAGQLESAIIQYQAAQADSSRAESKTMVKAFLRLFIAILPHASDEARAALVELCAIECGRERVCRQQELNPPGLVIELQ